MGKDLRPPDRVPQVTAQGSADTGAQGQTLNEPRSTEGVPLPLPTGESRSGPQGTPGAAPERIGRYRILKKLGQGGMGAVYLAHDEQLDRQVALKVPSFSPGDSDSMLRFQREARAAA